VSKVCGSIFLSSVLIILALAGCDSGTGPSAGRDDILPLSYGNIWIGEVTAYNQDGEEVSTYARNYAITGSQSIYNEAISAYEEWAKFAKLEGSAVVEEFFVKNDDSGLWRIFQSGSDNTAYLWWKFPSQEDDQYSCAHYTIDVTHSDTLLETDCGSFHCYCFYQIITADPSGVERKYYVAPKKGLIREEFYMLGSNEQKYLQSAWEITSLDL
jgi:hypothetical protein